MIYKGHIYISIISKFIQNHFDISMYQPFLTKKIVFIPQTIRIRYLIRRRRIAPPPPPFSILTYFTQAQFLNICLNTKIFTCSLFLLHVSRQYLDLLGLHPFAISHVHAAIRHSVFLVLSIYMFL